MISNSLITKLREFLDWLIARLSKGEEYNKPNFSSALVPAELDWPQYYYFRWRKLYDWDRRLIQFEDKLALKEMAKTADIPCVPTLAILPVKNLDLSLVPALQIDAYVLKTNHGCGDAIFVKRLPEDNYYLSGKNINGEFPRKKANKHVRDHFRRVISKYPNPIWSSQWAVAQIQPKLLFAEPVLPMNDDYKAYVVGGKVLWIETMTDRWEAEGYWGGLFDTEWNLICTNGSTKKRFPKNAEKAVIERFPTPKHLNQIFDFSKSLVPDDMSLMRVDFFQKPSGEFVLGEVSAYSGCGRQDYSDEIELYFGQILYDEMKSRGFLAFTS